MKIVLEENSTMTVKELVDELLCLPYGILLWLHKGQQIRFIKKNIQGKPKICEFYWTSTYVNNKKDSWLLPNDHPSDFCLSAWIIEQIIQGDEFYYFKDDTELIEFLRRPKQQS